MNSRRLTIVLIGIVLMAVSACDRETKPAPPDASPVQPTQKAPIRVEPLNAAWDAERSGPALIRTVSNDSTLASVVLPHLTDSTLEKATSFNLDSVSDAVFDLFTPAGAAGSAILNVRTQPPGDGCLSWPTGKLSGAGRREWRVGFQRGVATALRLDSLHGMSAADSSSVTIELTRLASATLEGRDPVFQGLPFSVRQAYRFSVDGHSVLLSEVIRRINQEADPREERILMIAERPSGDTQYYVAFHSRVTGSEDVVRVNELLAAVRFLRGNIPALVVTFNYEEGSRVVLLERTGNRAWKLAWRSAYTGC